MTMAWPPRTGLGVPAQSGIPVEGAARNAPIIVLTYGNAGGRRLRSALASQPELTCTMGTGVLAACEQAAAAWRRVEGRPAKGLSPLAVKSIRSMVTLMVTAATARSGRPRWCETAAAEPGAAEVFLQVFPGTRFVCLHRSCPDLISAVLLASPWGLSGPGFAPYVAAHPGSTVAAMAGWWAARARPLLDFERAHPAGCFRVRYEDFSEDPEAVLTTIRAFTGLGGPSALPPEPAIDPDQAPDDTADLEADVEAGLAPPLGQIPPVLLAQVNQLHAELGYPPLGLGGTK